MNHDQQSPIRPACLRPADDDWVQPTGEEVREVLRRAGLTGAGAARVLGMKGATGRGIRRYTGGDAPIPYPSWAILCDMAGLGKIWGESGGRAHHGGAPLMVSVDTVEWTETRAAEFLSRLQKDESTWDFLKLWRRCNVEEHVRSIEDVINGSTALTEAGLADCRMGLMRLRQAAYALGRLANTRSWSEGEVVQAVVRRYVELASDAEDKLRTILQWTELPSED